MTAPDVTVVVTGHHEGDLCRPTFAALARAIEEARAGGIAVEVVGVLDRADAVTAAIFEDAMDGDGVIGRLAPAHTLVTDLGDRERHATRVYDTRAPHGSVSSTPTTCPLDAGCARRITWPPHRAGRAWCIPSSW